MKISETLPAEFLGAIADAISSNSFDSVMVTQAAARTPIIYVNEAFTKLTGYAAEDVLGKSPALLQGPATDNVVLDQLREDLESGRNFEGQATNYRKDGTPFTMHWRVVALESAESKVLYYLAVQRER